MRVRLAKKEASGEKLLLGAAVTKLLQCTKTSRHTTPAFHTVHFLVGRRMVFRCPSVDPAEITLIRDYDVESSIETSAPEARSVIRHAEGEQDEQPKQRAEHDADDDAGHQRKIKRRAAALEHDVAGQPAQADVRQERPGDASDTGPGGD